jgi:hypothetical protein
MKSLVLIAGLVMAVPAVAKPKEKEPAAAPSKDSKDATIKDTDAMKYVQSRLEEQTGAKGWKITLGDLMGMAREFNATNGNRSEKGTVNVSKDYPNEGALRVYVQPRD